MNCISFRADECSCCKQVDCSCKPRFTCWLPGMALYGGLELIADVIDILKLATCPSGCCWCSGLHGKHAFHRKLDATTDIKLEAQMGEQRAVAFLVENNRPHEESITFRARPWVDAYGQEVQTASVEFEPAQVKLKPGEAAAVRATVRVAKPFEPDMAYFTEFILAGVPAKPISVGMLVLPLDLYAYYALSDPCRRRHGRFVEFCWTYRDCCSGGCACSWDPHYHWHDTCFCNWHYLPHFQSTRPTLADTQSHLELVHG